MRTEFLLLAAAAALLLQASVLGALLPDGVAPPDPAARSLPPAEFDRLHAAVLPRGERWAEIPWETDLEAARRRAAREGKPILMWIMDGHPLGCT